MKATVYFSVQFCTTIDLNLTDEINNKLKQGVSVFNDEDDLFDLINNNPDIEDIVIPESQKIGYVIDTFLVEEIVLIN